MNIPGYQIERELGYGGMATVYLAVQESLGRHVALKVMSAALAADRTFSERFIREARTVAQLNHPNIVAIHDVGVVDFHHYLSLEYISGGDLKGRIKQGTISPDEALGIARQIASGLGYAHGKGIVHRDVKPENILFREDGTAVLTDFGIAKAGGGTRMTGTGMSIGTPHYMSPEQARGREVDGRSDLYALGVLLYEMLTGQVPYEAEDSLAVGIMHVNEPVPELPEHLNRYQPLIDGLMAKEPNERYQDSQELIQMLDRVNDGEDIPLIIPAKDQAVDENNTLPQTKQNVSASETSSSGSGWKWGIGGALLAAALFMGISEYQDSQPVIMSGGGMIGGGMHVAESPSKPKHESPPEAQQPSLAEAGTSKNGADTIADTVTKPEDVTPPPLVVKKYPLTIEATPSDARIRILNIKPKYHPGIELVPGKYTIDISKAGYQTFRGSIELTAQIRTFTAELEKKAPPPKKPPTREITVAGIEMVRIPSGNFQMGSNNGKDDEKPVHRVHINSFKMGKYEVTQAQWQAVMGSNPSYFKGDNNPVEEVSWDDAQQFIRKLNNRTGQHFRLPSEAEWEYAARAGSTTKYSWGDSVGSNRANCDGCGSQWDNSQTARVGSFQPNQFGLYDMHGNVWEWVEDMYHDSYNGAPSDGSEWEDSGSERVLRGGSWTYFPLLMRSADRHWFPTGYRFYDIGLRLVQD